MLSLSFLLTLTYTFIFPVLGDYNDRAFTTIQTLQDTWYNTNTGRWNGMWWESANIVTTIAKFGFQNADFRPTAHNIIATTFEKIADPPGGQPGGSRWLNGYYDDEGWWALAWIASYDLTGDPKYLDTAKNIFEDMTGGWTTPCNGGIWWDKDHKQIAAISNELFLSVAAHLANRVTPDQKNYYVDWAKMEWDWFSRSGIINSDNIINDGIDQVTCKNDGRTTFTYNQGVILGGLAELFTATRDPNYLNEAKWIASGALNKLTVNGILTEPVQFLDQQAAQFKGAFVRGLADLVEKSASQSFTNFLKQNADSAWTKGKNGTGIIMPDWQGWDQGTPGATSHASGVDLFVATAQVTTDHVAWG